MINKIVIVDDNQIIKIKNKKVVKIDFIEEYISKLKQKKKIILTDESKTNNFLNIHLYKNKININSPYQILILNEKTKKAYLYKLGILINSWPYEDKNDFLNQNKKEFSTIIDNNRIIFIEEEYNYYEIIKQASIIYKNPYLKI